MVRIVTDSTCDLPPALVERHNIVVVPAALNIDGRTLRDGVDISRGEYYARLPGFKDLPATAAPSAGEFEAAFQECGAAPIISLNLASQLSGLYNAARLAAEAFGPQVTVVDSGQLSMGLGWQVLAAAEAAARGAGPAEVLAAAEAVRRRVKVFAVLDTIEFLRRGGRASAFVAALGGLLQIKPLLEVVEGEVKPVGRQRLRPNAVALMCERLRALGPLQRLAVLHTACAEEAQVLAAQFAAQSAEPPLVVEATTVIGTHTGPHALGFAAVPAA
jgi:DegV family protein with EDD domain